MTSPQTLLAWQRQLDRQRSQPQDERRDMTGAEERAERNYYRERAL